MLRSGQLRILEHPEPSIRDCRMSQAILDKMFLTLDVCNLGVLRPGAGMGLDVPSAGVEGLKQLNLGNNSSCSADFFILCVLQVPSFT